MFVIGTWQGKPLALFLSTAALLSSPPPPPLSLSLSLSLSGLVFLSCTVLLMALIMNLNESLWQSSLKGHCHAQRWVRGFVFLVEKFTYCRLSSSFWISSILGHPTLKPAQMLFFLFGHHENICFFNFLSVSQKWHGSQSSSDQRCTLVFSVLSNRWLWEHPAVRGPPPKPGAEEAGWLSCFRLSSSHLNSFAKLSLASGHPLSLPWPSSVCGPVAVGRSRWWFLPPCHIVVYLSHFVSCSLVRKYAMIILGVRLVLTLRTKCQSWTIPRWTTSAKMTTSYSSWRRDSSISCRCPRTRSKSDQAVNMDVFLLELGGIHCHVSKSFTNSALVHRDVSIEQLESDSDDGCDTGCDTAHRSGQATNAHGLVSLSLSLSLSLSTRTHSSLMHARVHPHARTHTQSLAALFFALCFLLRTWSITAVTCRACHLSGIFFSLWHTHSHIHAAAYLKYRRYRLSCLPFVWHFFFHCDTHARTHARTHTHTRTHTHARARCTRARPHTHDARTPAHTLLPHFSLLCACYCLLGVSLLSPVLAIYLAFSFHRHTRAHPCVRARAHTHTHTHTHALFFLYCLMGCACCYLLEFSLVLLVVLAIHLGALSPRWSRRSANEDVWQLTFVITSWPTRFLHGLDGVPHSQAVLHCRPAVRQGHTRWFTPLRVLAPTGALACALSIYERERERGGRERESLLWTHYPCKYGVRRANHLQLLSSQIPALHRRRGLLHRRRGLLHRRRGLLHRRRGLAFQTDYREVTTEVTLRQIRLQFLIGQPTSGHCHRQGKL